ncbi:hypothetical protein KSP39_PZI003851 [Platanthera zijinensis]|uniref:Uncharacterized protein n=1 Tax=Platanthera zijinensis TaxID=2320716 RepID=A0AAP0BXK9_9ASPA
MLKITPYGHITTTLLCIYEGIIYNAEAHAAGLRRARGRSCLAGSYFGEGPARTLAASEGLVPGLDLAKRAKYPMAPITTKPPTAIATGDLPRLLRWWSTSPVLGPGGFFILVAASLISLSISLSLSLS